MWPQRTLTVGVWIAVQPVSSLARPGLDRQRKYFLFVWSEPVKSKLVKLETSCTAMILPPTAYVLWWPWRAVVRHSKKTFYSIGPWPSTGEKRYSGSASNTIRWNPEAQSAEMRIGMMMKYPGLSPMVRPSFRKSVRRISSTISIRLHILNEFRKIYLSQKNLKNRTNRKLETRWTFSTSSINARLGPVPITLSKCPTYLL